MFQDKDMEDRPGRVTILDVAAAAGVSKSTVSRILDERLPRSDSETARRVRQVAAELGYARDAAAAFGPKARAFDDTAALIAALNEQPDAAQTLVKGSRFMKMESVVSALQQQRTGDPHAA